ncbi:MAG: hypothetical protein B7Z66_12295 [Chromatiales bacterium 21-64-14]|nr:MAG: hypothetical protein B7Z66_12295 [Chromatiales bacterium 21-64-14]HQU15500.1 hypothetical protein [Gammaproteobacteria bacterium]
MTNQHALFTTASPDDDAAYLAAVRKDRNYSYGELGAEMLAACFIEANEDLFKQFLKSLGVADLEEFFRSGLHHWLQHVGCKYAEARAVSALKLPLKGSLNTLSAGGHLSEADYRLDTVSGDRTPA